jgi:hypothetical protein
LVYINTFWGKYCNLLSIMLLAGVLHGKRKTEGKLSQNIFKTRFHVF